LWPPNRSTSHYSVFSCHTELFGISIKVTINLSARARILHNKGICFSHFYLPQQHQSVNIFFVQWPFKNQTSPVMKQSKMVRTLKVRLQWPKQ
jgi:hypothetical protein